MDTSESSDFIVQCFYPDRSAAPMLSPGPTRPHGFGHVDRTWVKARGRRIQRVSDAERFVKRGFIVRHQIGESNAIYWSHPRTECEIRVHSRQIDVGTCANR